MKNNYVDIEFNFSWSNTTCNVNVLPSIAVEYFSTIHSNHICKIEMGTQSHIHTDVEFSALVYNATYRPEQVLVCMFGSIRYYYD